MTVPAIPSAPTTIAPASAAEHLRCWGTLLSCWITAGCFVVAWWWPRELDGGRWVKLGVGILVMEFVLIHASGFLNHTLHKQAEQGHDPALRLRGLLPLVGLYSLFALAIAFVFESWTLFGIFALLIASRAGAAFRPFDAKEMAYSQRRVAVSAMLFLGLTAASIFVPLPVGGIDASLLRSVWPNRGSGLWERFPQQALAMGAVYFVLLGWFERKPPGPVWYRKPRT